MRAEPNIRLETYRIQGHPTLGNSEPGKNYGYFERWPLKIISSGSWEGGLGWEHVSVSCKNRCPTWDEMCLVKEMFWSDDETVIQFHPKHSEYVNHHPYCLHLWKKIAEEHELPPRILTGPS